jgi:hypothetical protein
MMRQPPPSRLPPYSGADGERTSDDVIRHLEHAINVTGEDSSPPELL